MAERLVFYLAAKETGWWCSVDGVVVCNPCDEDVSDKNTSDATASDENASDEDTAN